MKIIALFAAAALSVGALVTAAPADAQRHGWNDRHYRGGPGWRDHDRWQRARPGWRGDRRGWRGRPYARSRVVCRVQRGYYGPVRRCFRVYR